MTVKEKTANDNTHMADSSSSVFLPSTCEPTNEKAKKIIAKCVSEHSAHKDDCNHFIKAVAKHFFGNSIFDGLDADGIIGAVKANNSGWTIKTGSGSITDAIKAAKDGYFVGAGMTSGDLNDTHGHIAVVTGCDGQQSGNKIVPLGFAGSLNESARITGGKLSGTFPAQEVRDEKVTYFYRKPTQEPSLSAFGLLLEMIEIQKIAGSPIKEDSISQEECAGIVYAETGVLSSGAGGAVALAEARRFIAGVAYKRKGSGVAKPKIPTKDELKNPITKAIWDRCQKAAEDATNDDVGDCKHFVIWYSDDNKTPSKLPKEIPDKWPYKYIDKIKKVWGPFTTPIEPKFISSIFDKVEDNIDTLKDIENICIFKYCGVP